MGGHSPAFCVTPIYSQNPFSSIDLCFVVSRPRIRLLAAQLEIKTACPVPNGAASSRGNTYLPKGSVAISTPIVNRKSSIENAPPPRTLGGR
jgi:hypothetical protein